MLCELDPSHTALTQHLSNLVVRAVHSALPVARLPGIVQAGALQGRPGPARDTLRKHNHPDPHFDGLPQRWQRTGSAGLANVPLALTRQELLPTLISSPSCRFTLARGRLGS